MAPINRHNPTEPVEFFDHPPPHPCRRLRRALRLAAGAGHQPAGAVGEMDACGGGRPTGAVLVAVWTVHLVHTQDCLPKNDKHNSARLRSDRVDISKRRTRAIEKGAHQLRQVVDRNGHRSPMKLTSPFQTFRRDQSVPLSVFDRATFRVRIAYSATGADLA